MQDILNTQCVAPRDPETMDTEAQRRPHEDAAWEDALIYHSVNPKSHKDLFGSCVLDFHSKKIHEFISILF